MNRKRMVILLLASIGILNFFGGCGPTQVKSAPHLYAPPCAWCNQLCSRTAYWLEGDFDTVTVYRQGGVPVGTLPYAFGVDTTLYRNALPIIQSDRSPNVIWYHDMPFCSMRCLNDYKSSKSNN